MEEKTSVNKIVLLVFQNAISFATNNVVNLPRYDDHSSTLFDRAKELVRWPKDPTIVPLISIFDGIGKQKTTSENYWPPQAIEAIIDENSLSYPKIPYPVTSAQAHLDITAYQEDLKQKGLKLMKNNDWEESSLLSLFLEKYGSFISFGTSNISLNDLTRSTAAVATSLAQAHNDGQSIEQAKLRLVAADISGIQKFIYNISSDGALKSLRARSFFLELVTIEIVQQLLTKLELPQSNVIYSGGGKVYILAADTKHVEAVVADVHNKFNDWFADKYQGNLSLATASVSFPQEDIGNSKFADHWQNVTAELREYKNRKFSTPYQLNKLLKASDSHEPCKVCHRDDTEDLQPLNPLEPTKSVPACITCRSMFQLGTQLFKAKLIVRSGTKPELRDDNYSYFGKDRKYPQYVAFDFGEEPVYYRVFGRDEPDIPKAIDKANKEKDSSNIWLIDNWDIDNYRQSKLQPILLGNYYLDFGQNPG